MIVNKKIRDRIGADIEIDQSRYSRTVFKILDCTSSLSGSCLRLWMVLGVRDVKEEPQNWS